MGYSFVYFDSRATRWHASLQCLSRHMQFLENMDENQHKLVRISIAPYRNAHLLLLRSHITKESVEIIEHLRDGFPLRTRSGPIEARRQPLSPRDFRLFPLRTRSGPIEACER